MKRNTHNSGFTKDSGVQATRKELGIACGNNRDARFKRRETRYKRKCDFLLHKKIECELWRGNFRFGQKKLLTMTEMGLNNKKLVVQYGKAINENPNAFLWKWKIVNYKEFAEKLEAHIANY